MLPRVVVLMREHPSAIHGFGGRQGEYWAFFHDIVSPEKGVTER